MPNINPSAFVGQAERFAQSYLGSNPAGFINVAGFLDKLSGPSARAARGAALAYVLESLVNYGKANGPWRDRTGNLRRSYNWEIIQNPMNDQEVIGIFANTAEYAIYVEHNPRLWVLSGAFNALRPMIVSMLGSKMKYSGVKGPTSVRLT